MGVAALLGGIALPLGLAALGAGGFLVNEWSHGAMSEALGLGHHHMLDPGPGHCADYGRAHEHAVDGAQVAGGHCSGGGAGGRVHHAGGAADAP